MKYILETENLKLRELTPEDAPFIVKLVNTEGWLKYIGDRNIKTDEQAIAYLENGPLKSYREHGFGLWLVETKDHLPIGMCGLLKRDHLENPDIGFAFLPEFMGRGFAHEIATATLAFAKDVLKLKTICAITVPHNNSSIKLLEKIGMKFSNRFYFPNDKKEELLLYSN